MDSYIFFILHDFSLPLKPAIRRMGNAPRCKEQKAKRVSTLMYILLQDFQNFSRLLISELIVNVKYNFNIPFRVTLKIIIMRASTQFHRWCTVKILRTLSSEKLLLNWIQGLELSFNFCKRRN